MTAERALSSQGLPGRAVSDIQSASLATPSLAGHLWSFSLNLPPRPPTLATGGGVTTSVATWEAVGVTSLLRDGYNMVSFLRFSVFTPLTGEQASAPCPNY
jgi:hypothetical protein